MSGVEGQEPAAAHASVKMEVEVAENEPSGSADASIAAGGSGGEGGGWSLRKTGHKAALMKAGDTVVLEHKISNHAMEIRFIILKPGEKVKIAKGNLNHKFIIGHPFGTKFEVTKAGNEQTVSVVEEDETDRANMMADELQGEEEDDPEVKRDNRDLVDWNKLTKGQRTGQKLSDQDVADLRAQGADGKSLIKSLAENSETFKSKTEFSQEKWVKRKASKHMPSFIAHRCTSLSLCRGYFQKDPMRSCHMREDALARLLTVSNVQPGSRALVCDSMNGLLLASVVERMGGMGLAINVFNTPQPSIDAVRWMNFDKSHLQTIINVPLHELSYTSGDLSLLEEPEPAGKPAAEKAEQAAEGDAAADGPPACENKWERKTDDLSLRRERMKSSNKTYMTFRSGIEDQRKPTLKEIQEEIRGGFDSLVVGGSLHPVLIMPELIKHLKPSSPFAVYSQFAEPLLETMEALIKADECLDMSIAETWMREYQVLPGRTHPNMHMTAASGFLLMGCKVVRKVDKPLPVPNKPKRGEEGYEGGGAEKKQKIGEGQ